MIMKIYPIESEFKETLFLIPLRTGSIIFLNPLSFKLEYGRPLTVTISTHPSIKVFIVWFTVTSGVIWRVVCLNLLAFILSSGFVVLKVLSSDLINASYSSGWSSKCFFKFVPWLVYTNIKYKTNKLIKNHD